MRNNDNAIKIVDGNINGSNWRSSKTFPFHVHWPTGKEEKKSPRVGNIPDIERAKMPEFIIRIKIIFPKVYSYIMFLVFEKEQYCH